MLLVSIFHFVRLCKVLGKQCNYELIQISIEKVQFEGIYCYHQLEFHLVCNLQMLIN